MHLERIAEIKAAEQADSEKLMLRIQQKVFLVNIHNIYSLCSKKRVIVDMKYR